MWTRESKYVDCFEVSFWCWIKWSISSWHNSYMSVFFPKAEWWVAELLFLSLNNSGLNFLQNECSWSSKIYLSPERLRKMFTFQYCKFLNDKIDQNTKCQVPNTSFWYKHIFYDSKIVKFKKRDSLIILLSAWDRSHDSTAKKNLSKDM